MEKIALVTGSSRGIGRAVARRLAAEGYAVCVNYRVRQDCAMSLVSEISAAGGRAMAVQADVAHRVQVNEMVRRVEGELGPVSLLVNNAGVAGQALFQDITDALWHRYFAVNVDGAFHTIQAVLPHMLHEHAGCIVNVSSIWGLRGASCEVTYSATKGALIALTRSLASELAPTGIRVNCVAPGVIKTDMLDALPPEVLPQLAQETPLGRWARRRTSPPPSASWRTKRRRSSPGRCSPVTEDLYCDRENAARLERGGLLRYICPSGRGWAWSITRPKQVRLRPLPRWNITSISERFRFRENRYTIPSGSR